MASVGEVSVSFLQSALPTGTTTNIIAVALALTLTACIVHYTSPMRMTSTLVAALHETEEEHLSALEFGVLLNSDIHTKMLAEYVAALACIVVFLTRLRSLQMKVSILREGSLCNSLLNGQALQGLIKGHAFAVIQRIWEVRVLKTQIEVCAFPAGEAWSFVLTCTIEILKERKLQHLCSLGTLRRSATFRRPRNPSGVA
ncbi:hypothetical protein C8R43DRAFT_1018318 [Mycena crocata]|nr:hypothetical protein C8R43DRAFT_1018318 [Mycena crocata]